MANEKTLIRFRCYNCNKLLGTSSAKAGKTTTCPSCKAELIVPEPDEPDKAALAAATRSLIPDLDESPRPRPPAPEPEAGPRHDPTFSWEEIDTTIFQAPGGPAPIDLGISLAAPPVLPPAPEPVAEPEPVAVPAPTIDPTPPPDPVVPAIEVTPAPILDGRAPRRRPGEVVLTHAVITSWAVFMLLSLGIAFVAGLFVGHFVWK